MSESTAIDCARVDSAGPSPSRPGWILAVLSLRSSCWCSLDTTVMNVARRSANPRPAPRPAGAHLALVALVEAAAAARSAPTTGRAQAAAVSLSARPATIVDQGRKIT